MGRHGLVRSQDHTTDESGLFRRKRSCQRLERPLADAIEEAENRIGLVDAQPLHMQGAKDAEDPVPRQDFGLGEARRVARRRQPAVHQEAVAVVQADGLGRLHLQDSVDFEPRAVLAARHVFGVEQRTDRPATYDGKNYPGVYNYKDNALFTGLCYEGGCDPVYPYWNFGNGAPPLNFGPTKRATES